MKIEIAAKLRPFCHLPGTSCLIPNTTWVVQAFPTLLKFENLVTGKKKEERLDWHGPVANFTVEQDLEKGCVRIFGQTAKGYRSHVIKEGFISNMTENLGLGPSLSPGAGRPQLARISNTGDVEIAPAAGAFASARNQVSSHVRYNPSSIEKLSLGIHKALDWELVRRRCDMAEILPVWFRLGQLVPEGGKAHLPKDLKGVFQTYFHGILTPRLRDEDHLGIFPEKLKIADNSLALLREGFLQIRALFFQEEGNVFSFLPSLAPEFHSGRFLSEEVDFEWSKKVLQKVIIRPKISREISLDLQKSLKSFRLRFSPKEKGQKYFSKEPLSLETNRTLFLDRFEK